VELKELEKKEPKPEGIVGPAVALLKDVDLKEGARIHDHRLVYRLQHQGEKLCFLKQKNCFDFFPQRT
jgi:hypothetical protein